MVRIVLFLALLPWVPTVRAGSTTPPVSGNVIIDPVLWQTISDALKRSGMINSRAD